jgi:hypothetical protein
MPDGGGCRVATAVVGGCRLGHNRKLDGSSVRHQGQLGVTEGLLWEPRQTSGLHRGCAALDRQDDGHWIHAYVDDSVGRQSAKDDRV